MLRHCHRVAHLDSPQPWVNLTDTVVTRRAHTLVTHGPYGWVRHPFYDSMALLILASSLIAANWFFLLTGSVVLFLIVVRTRTEEEKLLARFGDAYRGVHDADWTFCAKRQSKPAWSLWCGWPLHGSAYHAGRNGCGKQENGCVPGAGRLKVYTLKGRKA